MDARLLPLVRDAAFFARRDVTSPSPFIRAPHPKTGIRPLPDTMRRILEAGWVAQLKIHGHRAQVHVPADPKKPIHVLNRQGQSHRKKMSEAMTKEVRRLFQPEEGWNVVDAEWLKDEEKLFVFDFLKKEGEILRRLTYPQRYALLPRLYLSPCVATLPLIRDLAGCLKALETEQDHIEGLVFKSLTTPGFADTSIIRCRKTNR